MTPADVKEIAGTAAREAVKEILLTIGIDVRDPLMAQRDFNIMRDVGRIATDSEFRKDLEHARKWRLDMAKEDGPTADLADARKRRKFGEAVALKAGLTAVGIIVAFVFGLLVAGAKAKLGLGV